MSGKTSIEWTDKTWNPTRGCSRVSEGCRNCYAEKVARRFSGRGLAYEGLAGARGWTGKVRFIEAALAEPLSWRKPARIFVNSMSDLFHESLPFEDIAAVFGVMAAAERHTFQILTKRPRRALEWFEWYEGTSGAGASAFAAVAEARQRGIEVGWPFVGAAPDLRLYEPHWPLPNVWLGVSVEDQKTADERIPLLLQTPAAVRFVSYEPALGPVDFERWVTGTTSYHVCADVAGMLRNRSFHGLADDDGRPMAPAAAKAELERLLANGVKLIPSGGCSDFNPEKGCRGHRNPRLDQLIIGGESGPGARPFDVAWMRAVVAQCREAGVAAFCKQWGAKPYESGAPVRLMDSKGGDISEWGPGDWPREFPRAA